MDGKVKEVGRQTCRFFAHQKLRVDYLWNAFFESKRLMANVCFWERFFFCQDIKGTYSMVFDLQGVGFVEKV